MGFVGGGGNIAIVTAYPCKFCTALCLNIHYFMVSFNFFYACLEFRFPDVETNPDPRRPVPGACRILCSNVRGLSKNLSDVRVASFQYDLLLCSETLVSDRRHISEFLVAGFGRPVLLCRQGMSRARGMAAYVRDGYGAFRQPKFECGCCEMLVCGARQNFYVFSLYRNPDLDDLIYDCLLTAVAAVQAACVRASFLFVGDLNGHRQEWLGSTTTNRHGVAALDFATVSGCDQLVIIQIHAHGGTLDLLMTDVPDLVCLTVVAPLGSSDHSSLSIAISMVQAFPILCVSMRVLIKHGVNWTAVCNPIGVLPWRTIWSAENPVERLNVHLSVLVERFVPTKLIHVHNKDKGGSSPVDS